MGGFKLRDKRIFKLEIVLCLAWARLLIRLMPFRWWRGTLGPIDRAADMESLPQLNAEQAKKAAGTGRMIRRLADSLPFKAVCLPQAMAGRWMLARRNIPTRIVIGTKRGTLEEGLLFHAWLIAGEAIVTGGEESSDFNAFRKQQGVTE